MDTVLAALRNYPPIDDEGYYTADQIVAMVMPEQDDLQTTLNISRSYLDSAKILNDTARELLYAGQVDLAVYHVREMYRLIGEAEATRRFIVIQNVYEQWEELRSLELISREASETGPREFHILSDLVAAQTTNLNDYLYTMNTLLLGYSSSGDHLGVVGTVGLNQTFDIHIPSVLDELGKSRILIGSQGLHPDFSDNTDQQVSFHIWSYVATTANPEPVIFKNAGYLANTFHEILQRQLTGTPDPTKYSWEDFLNSRVALELGKELRSGEVSPQEFGERFEEVFTNSFWDFFPEASPIFPGYDQSGLSPATLLESIYPLE